MDVERYDGSGRPDVLANGDSAPPSRARRMTSYAALVVLALTVASAAWLDHRARRAESEPLRACVRAGQSAFAYAMGSIGAMSQYVAPALSASAPPAVRADMHRLVRERARAGWADVRRSRDACRAVPARPWHVQLRAARSAYVAYLDAAVTYLDDVARDDAELAVSHPELDQRLAEARAALAPIAPGLLLRSGLRY